MLAARSRPYRAIFAARFLMMLQYRTAALAGIVTQFWFGAITIMVLAAFYRSGGSASISLADAITYVWLSQAFLGLLPWNVDTEIAAMMRSGNVAYEQLRPVDTYSYWFARAMAWRASATLLRSIPLLAVTALVLPLAGLSGWALQPPPGPVAVLLFAISLTATLALSSAMTTLLNISVIWTVSGTGVIALTNSLLLIFSGIVIPLPLFPDWAQLALICQPFAGLVDIPYRIYFANLSGAAALAGIALQLFWTLALTGLGRWLMAISMRRIHVQGG
jgi:viologen exporter family transport system permease protein